MMRCVLNRVAAKCRQHPKLQSVLIRNENRMLNKYIVEHFCSKDAITKLSTPNLFSHNNRQFSDKTDRPPEEPNQDINRDEELSSILKDIMSDFDEGPSPTSPNGGTKSKETSSMSSTTEQGDHDNKTPTDTNKTTMLSLGTSDKFEVYDGNKQEPILDFDEETNQPDFYLYQSKADKYTDVDQTRGVSGVFDLPELVSLLKQENMQDVAVIEIPKSFSYCDYLVVGTATSHRHLRAVVEFVRKVHKLKKNKSDPYVLIEGQESRDWKVLDMGNVVVHFMMDEIRERYNIELLWTVGEANDDLSQKAPDPLEDLLQQNIQYLDQIKAAEAN